MIGDYSRNSVSVCGIEIYNIDLASSHINHRDLIYCALLKCDINGITCHTFIPCIRDRIIRQVTNDDFRQLTHCECVDVHLLKLIRPAVSFSFHRIRPRVGRVANPEQLINVRKTLGALQFREFAMYRVYRDVSRIRAR